LNAHTIPIMRDNQDSYKPLEKHFGTLTAGMSFGESFMLEDVERARFFNAIAMTDCKILSLSCESYEYIMQSAERKVFHEKMSFLRSLPEFKSLSLPRSKLVQLCLNLIPVKCIKRQRLFKEGEHNKNVYLVRSGEI
jgi:CRP-like cAMP-binding protein